MQLKQLMSILKQAGLSELQRSCYTELVKQSPQPASRIAKLLDKPKTTILDSLSPMADEMGIIKRVKRKNKFFFSIESVDDLSTYLKSKREQIQKQEKALEKLQPELRNLLNYRTDKPKIYYYEGKRGLKQAFEQTLNEAKHIVGYGSGDDDEKYLPELMNDYYERRVKKKIGVTAIIPATDLNKRLTKELEEKHLRKTHLIPKEFTFPVHLNIYEKTVVFYSYEESFALKIRNKAIADCMRMIFDLAFERAGDFDKEIRQTMKPIKA